MGNISSKQTQTVSTAISKFEEALNKLKKEPVTGVIEITKVFNDLYKQGFAHGVDSTKN